MTLLLNQLGLAVIILIGMIGVFYPEKVQRVDVKMSSMLTFGIPNPILSFLETDEYLWMVRLWGAVSLLIVLISEYFLLSSR